MSQKSTEINKNDIPNDIKAKAEHDASSHGNSYTYDQLEDIIKKYGLYVYHKFLIDGTLPEEELK